MPFMYGLLLVEEVSPVIVGVTLEVVLPAEAVTGAEGVELVELLTSSVYEA